MTGSDACEQFFSKVGGMNGHERSYDISELVECATQLNRLAAMDLQEGIVGVGRSHKKHVNIWMKLHPLQVGEIEADQTNYAGIETNVHVVEALQEGFRRAQEVAVELEMNPSTSCRVVDRLWWDSPWKVEAKGQNYGGWCDVAEIEAMANLDDAMEVEQSTEEITNPPTANLPNGLGLPDP